MISSYDITIIYYYMYVFIVYWEIFVPSLVTLVSIYKRSVTRYYVILNINTDAG